MATPQFETVKIALDDGIAVLTLNRPGILNAWNTQMMMDMRAAIEWTDHDDAVRVVIVTGEGRAFCAGADYSPSATPEEQEATRAMNIASRSVDGNFRDGAGLFTLRLFDSLKPIIAAVNGPAVGAGATIQLGMDIRLASTEAEIGFVFVRRAATPEGCSTWFLARHVGLQTAFEWIFTGRLISAEEARDKGLVHSIHDPDELLPAARAIARQIIENAAPVQVAVARQLLLRGACATHPMAGHVAESRSIMWHSKTDDRKEGVQSFLEKRPPEFSGSVSREALEVVESIWPDWEHPPFR